MTSRTMPRYSELAAAGSKVIKIKNPKGDFISRVENSLKDSMSIKPDAVERALVDKTQKSRVMQQMLERRQATLA